MAKFIEDCEEGIEGVKRKCDELTQAVSYLTEIITQSKKMRVQRSKGSSTVGTGGPAMLKKGKWLQPTTGKFS